MRVQNVLRAPPWLPLAYKKMNFLLLHYLILLLGGSLADAISENYRSMRYFSEPELKDLLLQVARGLKYIHSMSLVHMDIKPSKYSEIWYFLH